MYFKNRTIEIRERCGAFLEKNKLDMKLERSWDGSYEISFEGDDYKSPMTIVFYGPEKKTHKEASWKRGHINFECHDFAQLGATGWGCWAFLMTTMEDFEGTPEKMLEQVLKDLEFYDLIPARKDLPDVCASEELGRTFLDLEATLSADATVRISRDATGEILEISDRGWIGKLVFPPAAYTEDGKFAYVNVMIEGQPPRSVRAEDWRRIADEIRATLDTLRPVI